MELFVSIGERLREERKRLGFSQSDFADVARKAGASGSTRQSQSLYEKGERQPDAAYLASVAAVGANLRYILTGDRNGPAPEKLSADERYLLDRYRGSPQPLKDAALRVLLGAEPSAPKKSKSITVTSHGGQAAGRDINRNK